MSGEGAHLSSQLMVDKADDSIVKQDGDDMYIAVVFVFIITKLRQYHI